MNEEDVSPEDAVQDELDILELQNKFKGLDADAIRKLLEEEDK